jgi:hypothetical protein
LLDAVFQENPYKDWLKNQSRMMSYWQKNLIKI